MKKYNCEHGLEKCFDCLEKHHKEETEILLDLIHWLAWSHDPGCDECGEHGGCGQMRQATKLLTNHPIYGGSWKAEIL